MKAAYTESGNKKGHYYGYSLGSTQMMIALAKYENQLEDYLAKVIMMAPCMINVEGFPAALVAEFDSAGVYDFFGPTWDVQKVCESASAETCGFVTFASQSPTQYDKNPMGVKLSSHVGQIVAAQSFQEYTEYTEDGGLKSYVPYDLESISTIPISLIIADGDKVCLPSQANSLAARLSTLDENVSVVGDHEYFYENNSAEYLKVLTDQL